MRRRHKLSAPISGIIDARTSIKMADKKEAKEKALLPAETEAYLKDMWETHRLAFEAVMQRLDDPENPNNLALTEEAQIHLSAMLKVQAKIDEKCKVDDEKGSIIIKGEGKEKSIGKSEENSKGDNVEERPKERLKKKVGSRAA